MKPLATEATRETYKRMMNTAAHTDGLGAYMEARQDALDYRAQYQWPEDKKVAETKPQVPRMVRQTGRKVAHSREEALAIIEAAFS